MSDGKLQALLDHIDRCPAGATESGQLLMVSGGGTKILGEWLLELQRRRRAVLGEPPADWKTIVAEIVRVVAVSDWDICRHCHRHVATHSWRCVACKAPLESQPVTTGNRDYKPCPKCGGVVALICQDTSGDNYTHQYQPRAL